MSDNNGKKDFDKGSSDSLYSTVCDCLDGSEQRSTFQRELMQTLIANTDMTKGLCHQGLLEFCVFISRFLLKKGKMGSRFFLKSCIQTFNQMRATYLMIGPRNYDDYFNYYHQLYIGSLSTLVGAHGRLNSSFPSIAGDLYRELNRLFENCSNTDQCRWISHAKKVVCTEAASPKSPRISLDVKRLFAKQVGDTEEKMNEMNEEKMKQAADQQPGTSKASLATNALFKAKVLPELEPLGDTTPAVSSKKAGKKNGDEIDLKGIKENHCPIL